MWLAKEMASGLGEKVAVRVGRPDAPEGPLLREIENLARARVKSPHVAGYRHCVIADNGARAVVFDYIEGEPLSIVIANQPDKRLLWRVPTSPGAERGGSSGEVSASGLILGVLRGLTALHTAEVPIVHGGVTPANILVSNHDGRAVLTDLRRSALAGGPPLSGVQTLPLPSAVESGRYLSPEQWHPEEACVEEGLDARVDVWAAGVVLHEMLSGQQLFSQVDKARQFVGLHVHTICIER